MDDDSDLFEMEERKEKETGGLDIFCTDINSSTSDPYDDVIEVKRDLSDLNAILLFFQQMQVDPLYQTEECNNIDFTPSNLNEMNEPIIRIIIKHNEMEQEKETEYMDDSEVIKQMTSLTERDGGDIKSFEEEEEEEEEVRWYDIYWWNESKDADGVHSLAMKTYASKGKMEYYLRYTMPSTAVPKAKSLSRQTTDNEEVDDDLLEWMWYDNDLAKYRKYDLGINVLKQLEASFHTNCTDIFPQQLGINFNYLLLREMTAKRKTQGKNVGLGYVLRFSYSNTERHNIVNMEQLSVWRNAPQFARNVQRRMNGKNSIFQYFSSNQHEYVNEWKYKYLLFTEGQQKFFWSHILAVAAATHYISVEIKNQVLNFEYAEEANPKHCNLLFAELDDLETQKEQRSYIEYPGFLVTPSQFFHHSSYGEETEAPKHLFADARSVVLQKFNANSNDDIDSDDLPKQYCPHRNRWKWRNGQQQFYCDECASLLQFAEFVRKFVLEYEHPEVRNFLWPWYRNAFHHNDFIKYHNYISRYNLSTLFSQSDILLQADNQPANLLELDDVDGCFKKIKKSFQSCMHQIRTCDCLKPQREQNGESRVEV